MDGRTAPLCNTTLQEGQLHNDSRSGAICTIITDDHHMNINSDVNKTKFLRPRPKEQDQDQDHCLQDQDQDQNNKTKTTGSKQRHLMDLTFK